MAEVTGKLKLDPSGVKTGADAAAQTMKGLESTMSGVFKGLGLKFAGIFAPAALGAGFAKAVKDGFANNVLIERAELTMRGFMGTTDRAKSAISMLRDEIRSKPLFSAEETFKAGEMLSLFADKSTVKLKGLINTAQQLSVLSPEQGLEGAAFALREAMTNDFVSLQERMNVPRSLIKKFRDEGKEGIDVVRAALKELGVDAQNIGIMQTGWHGLTGAISTMWEETKTTLSEPLFEELKSQAQEFLDWFSLNQGSILEIAKTTGEGIAAAFDAVGEAVSLAKETMREIDKSIGPEIQATTAYLSEVAGEQGWGGRLTRLADGLGQGIVGAVDLAAATASGNAEERENAMQSFANSRAGFKDAFTGWNHAGASRLALEVRDDARRTKDITYAAQDDAALQLVKDRQQAEFKQRSRERQMEAQKQNAVAAQRDRYGMTAADRAYWEQINATAAENERKKYSRPPALTMRVEGYGSVPQIMGT